ncbi:hypothetical protein DFJ77DRAFT_453012 [Powellomyces hirtus]|nr:hypothetical protein DFJ77DRAFT_453012 [Powellomyces hirtus]
MTTSEDHALNAPRAKPPPASTTRDLSLFLKKRIPGQTLWGDDTGAATGVVTRPTGETNRGIRPPAPFKKGGMVPVSRLPVPCVNARISANQSNPGVDSRREQTTPRSGVAAMVVQRWKQLVARRRHSSASAVRHDAARTVRSALSKWRCAYRRHHSEWRFEVKADVHRHYAVSSRVWTAWKQYVVARRVKWEERDAARARANHLRVRAAWTTWHHHMARRNALRAKERLAQNFASHVTTRHSFQSWRTAYRCKLARANDLASAAAIHNRVLLKSFLNRWTARWRHRRQSLEKMRTASVVDAQRKERAVVEAWKSFVAFRQLKAHRADAAVVLCNRHRASSAMRAWRIKCEERQAASERERVALDHFRAKTIKSCFAHWLSTQQSASSAQNVRMQFERERNRALQLRIVHSFKHLLRQGVRADNQYTRKAQQTCFSYWRHLVTVRTRTRELAEVKTGIEYFAQRIKAGFFREWKAFVDRRRTEKMQIRRADRFCLLANVRRSFDRWFDALISKRESRLADERGAVLHDQLLLSRTLNLLQRHAVDQKSARANRILAIQHHNQSIARAAIRAWWSYADESSHKMTRWQRGVRHAYLALTRKAWLRWRERVAAAHQARVRCRMALAHADRVRARKFLLGWKAFVGEREAFRTEFMAFAMRHCGDLLSHVIATWRIRLKEAREANVEAERMRVWREKRVMAAILRNWHEYAAQRSQEKAYDQMVLQNATKVLARVALGNAMKKWILRIRIERYKRMMEARADTFRKKGQMASAYGVWRCLYIHRQWEKKCNRKATRFLHRHLLRRTFHHWQHSRPDWRQIYTSRVIQPIAYWGTQQTRKAFTAWLTHTRQQRDLKNRIRDAMGWKRERLLKNVAVQWLRVAQQVREREMERAVAQQAVTTVEDLKRVHPFAIRWRAKTLASRAHRNGQDAIRRAELSRTLRTNDLLERVSASASQRITLPKWGFDHRGLDAAVTDIPPPSPPFAPPQPPQPPLHKASPKRHRPPPRTPAFMIQPSLDLPGRHNLHYDPHTTTNITNHWFGTQHQQHHPVPHRIEPSTAPPPPRGKEPATPSLVINAHATPYRTPDHDNDDGNYHRRSVMSTSRMFDTTAPVTTPTPTITTINNNNSHFPHFPPAPTPTLRSAAASSTHLPTTNTSTHNLNLTDMATTLRHFESQLVTNVLHGVIDERLIGRVEEMRRAIGHFPP